jgi:hypothetical protein
MITIIIVIILFFYYDILRLLYNNMRVHCSTAATLNIRNRKMDEAIASLYLFDLHVVTILYYRVVRTRERIIIKKNKTIVLTHTYLQSLSSAFAIDEAFIRCRYMDILYVLSAFVILCNFYHNRTNYISEIFILFLFVAYTYLYVVCT